MHFALVCIIVLVAGFSRVHSSATQAGTTSHPDNLIGNFDDPPCGAFRRFGNQPFIIGGTDAAPGEFPYHAAIWANESGVICGGSVIDQRHIVTAAHCFVAATTYHVTLGDLDWSVADGESRYEIEEWILHEDYNKDRLLGRNDIAIIRLEERIHFELTEDGYGSVNRVCLPKSTSSSSFLEEHGRLLISGWGWIADKRVKPVNLKKTELEYTTIELEEYDEMFIWPTFQSNITSTTCKGDSGGGYVKIIDGRYFLAGIVSRSYRSSSCLTLKVATRVDKKLDWIMQHTSIN